MNKDAQKVLEGILSSGIDVHRCAAARAFSSVGGAEAVNALVAALLDEDSDVRTDAAQSLLAIGDASAATQLMENLVGDPEPDVKKAALEALIAFRHAPVLPLLRKLAVSRTTDIFWDEDEFYNEAWDSWLDVQLIAIRGLAAFEDEEAVQTILTAMGDEMGQDVSEVGVAALASMGADGILALEQLFPISDPRLQRRIAEVVMRVDNPHAAAMFDTFLRADAPRIREIAVRGLSANDARLEPLFADSDAGVRATVVRHGGKNYSSLIKGMIADPDPKVRVEVFKLIAEQPDLYRDGKLIEAVKKAISGDAVAAKHAALALISLNGAEAVKGLTHVMSNKKVPLDFRIAAVEALEKAGPTTVPYLLRASADEQRSLRLAAMTALAGLAANDPVWPNMAGEGLLGALNGSLILPPQEDEESDETTPVEAAPEPEEVPLQDSEVDESTPLVAVPEAPAGSTLGKILDDSSATPEDVGEPTPVILSEVDERFLELSKQRKMSKRKMSLESNVAPYLDVRRFAAAVLGGVTNRQVVEALVSVLSDRDTELAEDALKSLVQLGDTTGSLPQSAQAPLMELYNLTASDTARVLALRAIARLPEGAEPVLREALTDPEPQIRVEAVRGLDHLGISDASVEAALSDSYIGVGIAAAHSLARHRREDAVEALIRFAFLNDGTHRRDIGQLLGRYAPRNGAKRLIELATDDTHLQERLVVIDALAEVIANTGQDEGLKVA